MAKKQPTLSEMELTPGSVDAAASEVSASRPRGTYNWPIDEIDIIEGFNIRNENPAHIRFLADSMKAHGYLTSEPISGFVVKEDGKNRLKLVGGHHRFAAAKLHNTEVEADKQIATIPTVIKPKTLGMRALKIGSYLENTGLPVGVVETAKLCKDLLDDGMTEQEIAAELGFKTGKKYVTHLLSVLTAPKEVREMISEGKVSATTAIKALKNGDTKEVVKKMRSEVKTAEKSGKKKVTAKNLKAEKSVNDLLVDELCKALRERLVEKTKAGKSGWDDPKQCTPGRLLAAADRHGKGGPGTMLIDQIAYLAMLRYRGVTGDDIRAMRGEPADDGDLV